MPARTTTSAWLSTIGFACALLSTACSSETAATDAKPAPDAASLPDANAEASDDAGDAAAVPAAIALSGCASALTAKVTVGGSQIFDLLLDTGSATLGVASSGCQSCADAGLDPLYQPGPGAIDQHQTATATYASSPPIGWSGEIFTDSVEVGGVGQDVDVNLVAIANESGFFGLNFCGTNASQGILGLGQTKVALAGTNSYLDQLHAAGNPDVFAMQMCPNGGRLWLGGYDPSFGSSAPEFTPMTSSQAYYTVTLSEVRVAGASLGLQASDFGTALVDSGSTNFMLPKTAFEAVTAALATSSEFVQLFGTPGSFFTPMGGCRSVAQSKAELDAVLPPLTLVFGSDPAVSIETPATESYLEPVGDGTEYCPGLIETPSATGGLPPVDLGAPILNGKVTVYDREHHRIGFAPAACP